MIYACFIIYDFLSLDFLVLHKPEISQRPITNVQGEVHFVLLTVNSDRPK